MKLIIEMSNETKDSLISLICEKNDKLTRKINNETDKTEIKRLVAKRTNFQELLEQLD